MSGVVRLGKSWPGKSGPPEHPAIWHMLDVGAVAKTICERSSLTGSYAQDQALCALVALHDIGKISNSFRDMLRHSSQQKWRHWEHSGWLLREFDGLIGDCLGGNEFLRRDLVEAVAGHHGGPREIPDPHKRNQQRRDIGESAITDARSIVKKVLGLFPDASLDEMSRPQGKAISWILNGLTVKADWVGSNPDWFPSEAAEFQLIDYWVVAQKRAVEALEAAGLDEAKPSIDSAKQILPASFELRPMQTTALECSVPAGPTLAIIEDSTGSGKTEASLMLASRFMELDKAHGIFFALPTMATANAMIDRLEIAASALFATPYSLALSHGRAKYSDTFRRLQSTAKSNPESGPHCGPWLADDRRKVLLADIGVGTIDQALLAVLPTRFNGLRLKALARKVLIVDEAHSYDPYIQAQLERLLMFHARLGGSAIVMTATLPIAMKSSLIKSFNIGLERERPIDRGRNRQNDPGSQINQPYPALTTVSREVSVAKVFPAPSTVRCVKIEHLSSVDQATQIVANASKTGAACVWVRNAVDDAIQASQKLRALGVKADLLHARFAICDRIKKEQAIQAVFGRDRPGQCRDNQEGHVLIATQVVEQSLDLDFDVMVSDLAPIGSVIQRAGRLWRHMDVRPKDKRPTEEPTLYLLCPDPNEAVDERWCSEVMPAGTWVYPPACMWRSARALLAANEISAPNGLRNLIEQVHGQDRIKVPMQLESAEFAYEGQSLVERQIARNNLLDAHEGFDQEKLQKVWDDEQFPTRLGVPQVTLALARNKAEKLMPYGPDWYQSELEVSAVRYNKLTEPNQELQMIKTVKADWSPARAKYVKIVPVSSDGRICDGLRYDPQIGATWT